MFMSCKCLSDEIFKAHKMVCCIFLFSTSTLNVADYIIYFKITLQPSVDYTLH